MGTGTGAGAAGGANGGGTSGAGGISGAGASAAGTGNASTSQEGQTCLGCHATSTPEWRRGPLGGWSLFFLSLLC